MKKSVVTVDEIKKMLLESLPKTEESIMYEEYKKVFGEKANRIFPMISVGYPKGVKEHGGVVAVYKECISKGVTWEELLEYQPPPKHVII